MHTVITDNTGRTWKRARSASDRAAGLWYSSAGTMNTLQQVQAFYGPLTVKEQQPQTFSLAEIRRYIVPTHNNN